MRTAVQNSAATASNSAQEKTGAGPLDASRHGEVTREFENFLRVRIVG